MPETNAYGLKPRQLRFCEEFLIDANATQAAIRAGYSVKAANRTGSRLLTKIDIQRAIADLRKAREERTRITVDMIVHETWENYRRCVAAKNYGAANKALELLGRHVGAFPQKLDHSGGKDESIPISVIRFNRHQPEDPKPSPG